MHMQHTNNNCNSACTYPSFDKLLTNANPIIDPPRDCSKTFKTPHRNIQPLKRTTTAYRIEDIKFRFCAFKASFKDRFATSKTKKAQISNVYTRNHPQFENARNKYLKSTPRKKARLFENQILIMYIFFGVKTPWMFYGLHKSELRFRIESFVRSLFIVY